MGLFNFLTKQPEADLIPEERFRQIINSIPLAYKSHKPFINCLRYIDLKEWEFAIDSLIELNDEAKNCFSEGFWKELASFSDKIKLTAQANYCREQSKNTILKSFNN